MRELVQNAEELIQVKANLRHRQKCIAVPRVYTRKNDSAEITFGDFVENGFEAIFIPTDVVYVIGSCGDRETIYTAPIALLIVFHR